MGDMRNVAERVSEGRSGSFFYYSHDGKFMVKTVSRAEVSACCLAKSCMVCTIRRGVSLPCTPAGPPCAACCSAVAFLNPIRRLRLSL